METTNSSSQSSEIADWIEKWIEEEVIARADPGEQDELHDANYYLDCLMSAANEEGYHTDEVISTSGSKHELMLRIHKALKINWNKQNSSATKRG
ncbi:hypothetical protein [Methylobacterium sp. WL8]|uniref:hypothetical protein n=1 Tax=Methylobacterium sp. WL8 TaxID=2603899 RepID=UPI0011CA2390|nr:hypothetical protein [Methylobacterium sp. WL8]TXN82697.1 hypothetical protein FV234_09140 [Methylobacterium sp. WL8]